MTKTFGPFGSRRASNWNIKLHNPNEHIKQVLINHRCVIHAIGFVVCDNHGKFSTRVHGGNSGFWSQIILKPNEHITQISGTYGVYFHDSVTGDYVISSLKVHTNICPNGYGPYGTRQNMKQTINFALPQPSNVGCIIELFGSNCTTFLRSIGTSIREQQQGIPQTSLERRGSIAYFATYRPPVPLDIYSAKQAPTSPNDETLMTDGKSYNCNGQIIPSHALKLILKRPLLHGLGTDYDVDSRRLSGLIFVSERTHNLETLHIALLHRDQPTKVFNFAEIFGTFKGVRMEDSPCFAGDYVFYVSTMTPPPQPHQPWTAVYRTNLRTGFTDRITPLGQADLNPSVSPNGKRIAVASFQSKDVGWDGAVEDLSTNIYSINVELPLDRRLVVKDGGWPTWGSDSVIFFHRNIEKVKAEKRWGVFLKNTHDLGSKEIRVTPESISAVTPAAIDESRVVVATMRRRFEFSEQDQRTEDQYRHIEIFDVRSPMELRSTEISRRIRPKADHFNPFVIVDGNGGFRVGYHRCNTNKLNAYNVIEKDFFKLQSPDPEVGVFRVSGVFPSVSDCGRKLAFVDNEFKAVWVANDNGLHMVYSTGTSNSVFSTVWNRKKDVLYVCVGPSFSFNKPVQIMAINNVCDSNRSFKYLTKSIYNSAFPSTNREGTRLVFRRSFPDGSKNLLVLENLELGEFGGNVLTLTRGNWIDTHCQWSPTNDWIAFASNRANPTAKTKQDLPDAGFFAVYLINAVNSNVVKVIDSGYTRPGALFAGHVNHPWFSPDGKSLVVTADLAGVSCDPVSLPLFVHSVRPYGDLFIVDLDPYNFFNNGTPRKYTRVTHSKYENSTAAWTTSMTKALEAKWKVRIAANNCVNTFAPQCPYLHGSGVESVHMTGHLCIKGQRLC